MKSAMLDSIYSYYDPPGGPSVSPFQSVVLLGQVYRPPPEIEREKEEREKAKLAKKLKKAEKQKQKAKVKELHSIQDLVSSDAAQKTSPPVDKESIHSQSSDGISSSSVPLSNSIEAKQNGVVGSIINLAGSAVTDYPSLPAQLRARYYSLPWFTYRNKFAKILPTSLTSDAGWGCLIRSGQMMMAQALLRLETDNDVSQVSDALLRKVLRLFADAPDQEAIFSIHNLAKIGSFCGCPIGKWFGPLVLCLSLKRIVEITSLPKGLSVQVAHDAQVSELDLRERSEAGDAILLLIPLRLGLQSLNSEYLSEIADTFSWPCSVGCVGGASQAARYFVGVQQDRVLMLDPHTTQKAVDMRGSNKDSFDIDSYRCLGTETMPLAKINPSLAFGFYLSSSADVDDFLIRAKALACSEYPLFALSSERTDARLSSQEEVLLYSNEEKLITDKSLTSNANQSLLLDNDDDDYYESNTGKSKSRSGSSKKSSARSFTSSKEKELDIDDFFEI